MESATERWQRLIGPAALAYLATCHVALFGLGGVGGHCAEALARSGLGCLTLIDPDVVAPSNLNRQLVALHSTLGRYKTEVAKARLLDINPALKVIEKRCFYLPGCQEVDFSAFTYVVDAVDTVAAKLAIALAAQAAQVPVISCLGTGNKLDPARLEVADIYATSVCPLARALRGRLRRAGVARLKVVYSQEPPLKPAADCPAQDAAQPVVGSSPFVPAAAGLLLASQVVQDLLKGASAAPNRP